MHEDLFGRHLLRGMFAHHSTDAVIDLTQSITEIVTANLQCPAIDKAHPCAGDVDNAETGDA